MRWCLPWLPGTDFSSASCWIIFLLQAIALDKIFRFRVHTAKQPRNTTEQLTEEPHLWRDLRLHLWTSGTFYLSRCSLFLRRLGGVCRFVLWKGCPWGWDQGSSVHKVQQDQHSSYYSHLLIHHSALVSSYLQAGICRISLHMSFMYSAALAPWETSQFSQNKFPRRVLIFRFVLPKSQSSFQQRRMCETFPLIYSARLELKRITIYQKAGAYVHERSRTEVDFNVSTSVRVLHVNMSPPSLYCSSITVLE